MNYLTNHRHVSMLPKQYKMAWAWMDVVPVIAGLLRRGRLIEKGYLFLIRLEVYKIWGSPELTT